jgi:hypothetical protein
VRVKWEQNERFGGTLAATIPAVSVGEMAAEVLTKVTRTVASSKLSRTLQLLRAGGVRQNEGQPDFAAGSPVRAGNCHTPAEPTS